MKNKKFKIVKTDLFKEQEKKLPKKFQNDLNKVLKKLAMNPTKVKRSMSIFEDASPEELRQWVGNTKVATIDLILEYLHNKNCLSERGEALAHAFWKRYVERRKNIYD